MNNGGLYGERSGWTLPGFPDRSWNDATLPVSDTTPGIAWYRTTFNPQLPTGQDVSVGVTITDDPAELPRAHLRQRLADGPVRQRHRPAAHVPHPGRILRADGKNTVAIASWSEDAKSGGLGKVGLTTLGNVASSLRVAMWPPRPTTPPPTPTHHPGAGDRRRPRHRRAGQELPGHGDGLRTGATARRSAASP